MNDCEKELLAQVELALLANGGFVWDSNNCECDPETNASPCRYCAIQAALSSVRAYLTSADTETEALDRYANDHAGDPATNPANN